MVAILIEALFSFTPINPREDCIVLDIILMADYSSSVTGYSDFVADALDTFVDRFKLANDGIRIGVMIFSTTPTILVGLSSNKSKVKKAIDIIRNLETGDYTHMIEAFELAGNEFNLNGRPNVRKMVILISDGLPTRLIDALDDIPSLKYIYNMYVCGVFIDTSRIYYYNGTSYNINNKAGQRFMKAISDGDCFVDSDYESLPEKLRKFDICI